jgi:hypothetical protein
VVAFVNSGSADSAFRQGVAAEQKRALIALDQGTMVAMGAHPLVPFLARMQVERMRRT